MTGENLHYIRMETRLLSPHGLFSCRSVALEPHHMVLISGLSWLSGCEVVHVLNIMENFEHVKLKTTMS